MINYIVINTNSVLFCKKEEIKKIKRKEVLIEVLNKMRKLDYYWKHEEQKLMEFLKKEIPIGDEVFYDSIQDIGIDGVIPIFYTIFNRDKVISKIRNLGSKTILPILIEGETIYIGPITGDEIIFCDFIKRLGANDIAIKEKIKM